MIPRCWAFAAAVRFSGNRTAAERYLRRKASQTIPAVSWYCLVKERSAMAGQPGRQRLNNPRRPVYGLTRPGVALPAPSAPRPVGQAPCDPDPARPAQLGLPPRGCASGGGGATERGGSRGAVGRVPHSAVFGPEERDRLDRGLGPVSVATVVANDQAVQASAGGRASRIPDTQSNRRTASVGTAQRPGWRARSRCAVGNTRPVRTVLPRTDWPSRLSGATRPPLVF